MTTLRCGSKTLLKWWSEPSVRDCGFRLAGTSVYLWGKSISGPAATPLFYPLQRPELQVTISGVWFGVVTCSHDDFHDCKPRWQTSAVLYNMTRSYILPLTAQAATPPTSCGTWPTAMVIDCRKMIPRVCSRWEIPVVSLIE